MKRCLITGIGGSIGCHVVQHFLKHTDWEIVGTDSFRHKGLTDRLPDWVALTPRVRIFRHDLAAPISRISAQKFGSIDYIVNLASISDVDLSIDDPCVAVRNNVEIALTMLEYARGCKGLEAFLHISTDEVYGPIVDDQAHAEWSPIIPSNPYAASKACQEAVAISYWRTYGVPLIIANIMNNFGEMQSGAKFPCMVQRHIRNGETIRIHRVGDGYGSRVYIHSRNAADALLFLLRRGQPYIHRSGQADRPDRYNIVGDRRVDNKELVEFVAEELGRPYKYEDWDVSGIRPGHDTHYGLDGSKLAALGWKSPLTFEESMRRTVRWYEENPEWLDPK